MTEKHFESLANALVSTRPPMAEGLRYAQWRTDVEAIASVCSATSPRFNYNRFIAACVYREKKEVPQC